MRVSLVITCTCGTAAGTRSCGCILGVATVGSVVGVDVGTDFGSCCWNKHSLSSVSSSDETDSAFHRLNDLK